MAPFSVHHRYFDHNATTPVSPAVVRAMVEAGREGFANPSSPHQSGAAARYLVEKARRTAGKVLGATRFRLVYTSGGSEAINLALRGVSPGGHLVASTADHKAVLDTLADLGRRFGAEVSLVPVDASGCIDTEALGEILRPETRLVSLLLANNEVGTLCPLEECCRIVRERSPGALIHLDAVQAPGRIPLHLDSMDVDLVSLSAHKCHGPKGVGMLCVRRGVELLPEITGGAQEEGLRAGTENVMGIVGFSRALELVPELVERNAPRIKRWRDEAARQMEERLGARCITPLGNSLPNTLSVVFPGKSSRRILAHLDEAGFACSSGSACTSSDDGPSHVLLAMGLGVEEAESVVRFSFGTGNRRVDIRAVVECLEQFPG